LNNYNYTNQKQYINYTGLRVEFKKSLIFQWRWVYARAWRTPM